MQQIEVPAEWDSIAQLLAFTDETERRLAVTHEQAFLLRLVVEEIATNIIKYGYGPGQVGLIRLACSFADGALRVVISDRGQPFDPRETPQPDLDSDLQSRSIGGLGIFLVRELADSIFYTHDPQTGWNELVVLKGQA